MTFITSTVSPCNPAGSHVDGNPVSTNETTVTPKRLPDCDVQAIFHCLHGNEWPTKQHVPPFTIIPVGPTGEDLSPPPYEFPDGVYVLLRPHKPSRCRTHRSKKPKILVESLAPKNEIPDHLKHLLVEDCPYERCEWSLSGPQLPQTGLIQQRYCYPKAMTDGHTTYSHSKGGTLWTMYGSDGRESKHYRLFHVYYSAKRVSNKHVRRTETKQQMSRERELKSFPDHHRSVSSSAFPFITKERIESWNRYYPEQQELNCQNHHSLIQNNQDLLWNRNSQKDNVLESQLCNSRSDTALYFRGGRDTVYASNANQLPNTMQLLNQRPTSGRTSFTNNLPLKNQNVVKERGVFHSNSKLGRYFPNHPPPVRSKQRILPLALSKYKYITTDNDYPLVTSALSITKNDDEVSVIEASNSLEGTTTVVSVGTLIPSYMDNDERNQDETPTEKILENLLHEVKDIVLEEMNKVDRTHRPALVRNLVTWSNQWELLSNDEKAVSDLFYFDVGTTTVNADDILEFDMNTIVFDDENSFCSNSSSNINNKSTYKVSDDDDDTYSILTY